MRKAFKCARAKPNVIFASSGEGMGKNAVIISLHKNYTDFSNFLRNPRLEGGADLGDYGTMLINLKEEAVKPLSKIPSRTRRNIISPCIHCYARAM